MKPTSNLSLHSGLSNETYNDGDSDVLDSDGDIYPNWQLVHRPTQLLLEPRLISSSQHSPTPSLNLT